MNSFHKIDNKINPLADLILVETDENTFESLRLEHNCLIGYPNSGISKIEKNAKIIKFYKSKNQNGGFFEIQTEIIIFKGNKNNITEIV